MAKWCEIGPRLLLITNRKSHISFQMTLNYSPLMTLKGHNALWYANRAVLWLNGKSWGQVPSDRALATSYRLLI